MMNEILTVLSTAMTPIGELRLSIPLALARTDLPLALIYILSVFGNMIPPLLILLILPKISAWLQNRFVFMDKFLNWLYDRTRRRTRRKIQRYGDIGLILLVAIPLPYTGAWTGALTAFLFAIPFKKALLNIFIGVLLAGFIVTALSLGLINIL